MKKNILSYIIIFLIMLLIPYVNVYATLKADTKKQSFNLYISDYYGDEGIHRCKLTANINDTNYETQFKLVHIENEKIDHVVYCYDQTLSFPANYDSKNGKKLNWTCYPAEASDDNDVEEIKKLKYVIGTGLNTKAYDKIKNSQNSSCNCANNIDADKCGIYKDYIDTQKKVWDISSSDNKYESFNYEDYDDGTAYISNGSGTYINLNTQNEYMNLEENFYVSEPISIKSDYKGEMKVTLIIDKKERTLDENIYITNANGNKVSTVKANDTIKISINKNYFNKTKEVTIKVSYKYYENLNNTNDVYLCKNNNGDAFKPRAQTLVYYEPSDFNLKTKEKILTLKIGYKCDASNPKLNNLKCNVSNDYSSECNHLTIGKSNYEYNGEKYNFSANITLKQTGNIVSVLNPETTYSGGGFNFDVMYYNEISWDYYNNEKSCTKNDGTKCTKELNTLIEKLLMEDKIYKLNDFENSITIKEVKFSEGDYNKELLKKCNGMNTFENRKIKSACIFTLQKEELSEHSGSISINDKFTTPNVKYKHYTPLSYVGDYNITAKISNFSRLKEKVAKSDSSDGKSWFGTWEDTFKECQIKLYPLYSRPDDPNTPTGKTRNVFIYRPIDITNPFPNRNAGMNWYEWYLEESNKKKLETSYNRLQYQITLDAESTSKIKKYNSSQNGSGGYFDWQTMDGSESKFINDYDFDIIRQNLG